VRMMPKAVRNALAAAALLGLAGCESGPQPTSAASVAPMPVSPQPTAAQLRPGLETFYFRGDFQDVDRMPTSGAGGRRGAPQPNLYANAVQGELWEAGARELYGVVFTGLIRLEAGTYQFAMNSNDGSRVTLDKRRILDDPEPHPTQLKISGPVAIAASGWYPILVQYFQRRGGAALELFWQPPGSANRSVIPPDAFAHIPGGG